MFACVVLGTRKVLTMCHAMVSKTLMNLYTLYAIVLVVCCVWFILVLVYM